MHDFSFLEKNYHEFTLHVFAIMDMCHSRNILHVIHTINCPYFVRIRATGYSWLSFHIQLFFCRRRQVIEFKQVAEDQKNLHLCKIAPRTAPSPCRNEVHISIDSYVPFGSTSFLKIIIMCQNIITNLG